MEIYGVLQPPTPAKPIPARSGHNSDEASTSGRGAEKEIINDGFLFTGSLSTREYLESNGNKGSPSLGVAGEDLKSTTTVQDDTSCIQEEAECDGKKAHGVHESQAGIDSVPSPPETKDSKKRRNTGIDLNKKPSQRARMKKHRPKVYDDSKPKKVPKPKTPKPKTPNRVQERRARRRKEKFSEPTNYMQNSTNYNIIGPNSCTDSHQMSISHEEISFMPNSTSYDIEAASRVSRTDLIPCKRRLDLDLNHPVERESHYVSRLHEKDSILNFGHGEEHDCFHRIVTSKRNTQRRSRFQNKSLKPSEDISGDNNQHQCGLDASVVKDLQQTKKHVKRFVYVYRCQKKSSSRTASYTSTLQVYKRTFRVDHCLQSSRRSGPNFPKMYKKRRTMRKKLTINADWWLKFLVNSKKKRPNRKRVQTTKEKVGKPNLLPLFAPTKRKRSVLVTRRNENLFEFPIFKAVPHYDESSLLCQEENFLQMTECLQLREAPIQEIGKFILPAPRVQGVDNTFGASDCLQLQEVPVVASPSLIPKKKGILKLKGIPKRKESKFNIIREMKMLIKRLAKLDINAECKALVVRKKDSGALVEKKDEKEKKLLVRVDLDEESMRVWKIVMENNGSQPFEEMDGDKKEWWERQRDVFRGRVDSFIAKMHLIQGNRRFSPWKGSVVDSVVGVYLTQNVSDHLSSSAFMCLAARFPVKPKTKDVDHDEVNASRESVKSNTEIYEGFSNNNILEQNMSASYADEINVIPTSELDDTEPLNLHTARFPVIPKTNDVVDHDEVNASQESVNSNTEIYEGFFNNNKMELNMSTSYADEISLIPISELSQTEPLNLQDKPCIDEIKSFQNLLEIEEVDYLKNYYNIDESPLIESKLHEKSTLDEEKSKGKEIEASNVQENSTLEEEKSKSKETEASNLHEKSTLEGEKSTLEEEKSTLDEEKSTLEEEKSKSKETEASNLQDKPYVDESSNTFRNVLEIEEADYLDNFCSLSALTESKVQEKSTIEEEKSTLEEEPRTVAPVCSLRSEITMDLEVNAVNNQERTKKGKKKSKKEEQQVKIDWEKLRENYCQNGEKEINEDYMDAVDWDAVYRAPVQEIANLIVERGMNNILAKRIKDFLDRMVKDHGTLDLEWLRDVPPDKAKEFLLSIDGIGLKSVECVRLLTLHHNAFPVDTNVGRVATRLGWVPLQPLPEEVQIHLLNTYPMVDTIQKYLYPRLCTLDQKTLYELHYQLITFGKVFCTKINPNCNACPMRAECRHYASAFASARLALPGPKGTTSTVTTIVTAPPPPPPPLPELSNWDSGYHVQDCEPIIEVPPSPEPYVVEELPDIEDLFREPDDDDEIPIIRLNTEEFKETFKETINKKYNICLPEADVSKAIVALTAQAASFRVRPMKIREKLRTIHIVYELPDSHPILAGFDKREEEDPSRYLLAIWPETSSSTDTQKETVKGTVLIPCRTANRGKFPLNGTYFQVNEVFADDETSEIPLDVPRHLLWNLSRRDLACGTSATSIFKALSTGDIQHIFWRGSICVRGFNRKTRKPQPLNDMFHISKNGNQTGNKNMGKKASFGT